MILVQRLTLESFVSLLVVLVTLVVARPMHAQEVLGGPITDPEIASLPSYCQYTQLFPGSRERPEIYAEYIARFGQGWTHMHHYCWALVGMRRYERMGNDQTTRNTLARSAVGDIDYVLRNTDRTFVFRNELLMRKGRILLRHGQTKEATQVLALVLSEWPDRADSYALAAEVAIAEKRHSELKGIFNDAEKRVKDVDRLKQIRAAYVNEGVSKR